MILLTELEEVIRLLPELHAQIHRIYVRIHRNMTIKTAYEVIILYQLHMPSYFLGHLLNIPYQRRVAYSVLNYIGLTFLMWTSQGLNLELPDYENDKMIFCDS